MAHRACPVWMAYFLLSPMRRFVHNPRRVLGPYVRDGMVVIEPGCAMGFFTLDLVEMVGERGRVVAIDVQPRMLDGLRRRARRAGVLARLDVRLATDRTLGIDDLADKADLALAIFVVHEVGDQRGFFAELTRALKPGGRLFLAEPWIHVSAHAVHAELQAAKDAGLRLVDQPRFPRARAALLEKPRESAE